MAAITLIYNPYIPQLRILIDGKQLPEYSYLVQFADEDIWMWHNKIWDALYLELRDDFFVQFVGASSDAEIIRYQCDSYEHCIGFEFINYTINNSLQERLGILNQYLKKNEIISYNRTIIDATFILLQDMQLFLEDIVNIDIGNLFCSTRIQTSNGGLKHFENTTNGYLFILSSNISEGLDYAKRYTSQNPIFVICMGEKNKLQEVNEFVVVYETINENLITTIFNCFLWLPLIKAFRSCYLSVLKSTVPTDELKIISAVEPLIKISVDPKIEVGKSNPIRITYEPDVRNHPKVTFKVLNENIASTDDICILGKKIGTTRLEAYCYGSKQPFETITLNIIQRNRIKKMVLSDDELVLGIGDTRKLQCDFFPVDADNANSIVWSSTDETVISVDRNGTIKCLNKGTCRIICSAENVSVQCRCEVKPYLQGLSINLPENRDSLSLEPMQEFELLIDKIPSDSIDAQITIKSSNCNIANVIGNRIIAKNVGSATITVFNSSKRKNISFSVEVTKKKKSFFKSLFGY